MVGRRKSKDIEENENGTINNELWNNTKKKDQKEIVSYGFFFVVGCGWGVIDGGCDVCCSQWCLYWFKSTNL